MVMQRQVMHCHVVTRDKCRDVVPATKHATLYYKVLLRTTKHYSSTTLHYKVLLESSTPVPLFTTNYNSSTTLYYSSTTPHQTLCSGCLPKFQPMLRLPTKVTLQHHQIMCLPQEVKLQHDQILRLPRKVTL